MAVSVEAESTLRLGQPHHRHLFRQGRLLLRGAVVRPPLDLGSEASLDDEVRTMRQRKKRERRLK
jgi:hypothetical protein